MPGPNLAPGVARRNAKADQRLRIEGRSKAERSDSIRRQVKDLEGDFKAIRRADFIKEWWKLKDGVYRLDKNNPIPPPTLPPHIE